MTSVLIESAGGIGHLVLSEPATLNSLTDEMVLALQAGLNQHEQDNAIQVIVIRSASERAFCAGGNMKQIRQLSLSGDFQAIDDFFKHEYALNLAIAQCSKPLVAIIDGVAMGGGLGLSVHAKFCVVTEHAVLAMPESRIGFFPDVGASYFLPRLEKNAGLWLALTAAAVKGSEAVQVGLATHYVKRDVLADVFTELESLLDHGELTADECLEQCLGSQQSATSNAEFASRLDARSQWFANADINLIRQRLIAASNVEQTSTDARHLLDLVNGASPHSVNLTFELFAKTVDLPLSACLNQEYLLSVEACKHPDFVEGVRAVLVDKDRNPRWQH